MASSSAKEIRRFTQALAASMGADVRIPEDPVEFARKLGMDPDPWQQKALRSEHPRMLLNCSRQSGKSQVAATIAAHRALREPGSLVLIVAPAERQAKETFTQAARAYTRLGEAVPADSYRKLGVALRNGSRIEALPGSERTVRGFAAVDLLVVDEAARVADELYFAVRPMLAV
jgi:phage terminase large subunit-like protein